MATMLLNKAVLPSAIRGQLNGFVDASLLRQVDKRTHYIYQMAELPARGMRALHAFAAQAGIQLTTTGRGRTLSMQWSIFGGAEKRYRPCSYSEYLINKPYGRTKIWEKADRDIVAYLLGVTIPDAKYWVKIKRADGSYPATASVPGTSDHGMWCADDVAEFIDGKLVSLTAPTIQWLYDNAPSCGFGWALRVEPWHLHWSNGDYIPQRVAAYEMPAPPPPPPPTPAPTETDWAALVQALTLAKSYTLKFPSGGPNAPQGEKDAVTWLQLGLNAHFGSAMPVDGTFGEVTDYAVRIFQDTQKLFVDGVVGPKTWAKLYP